TGGRRRHPAPVRPDLRSRASSPSRQSLLSGSPARTLAPAPALVNAWITGLRAVRGRAITSCGMAKWIRPLAGGSQWHVPARDRDFVVVNALCGERVVGALEVTSDDEKSERGGQCQSCASVLATKQQPL